MRHNFFNYKISTIQAIELINLLKHLYNKKFFILPKHGEKTEFLVNSISNNKKFIVNINYANININKYSLQGRTFNDNIPLIRLDITPNGVHQNHDETKIHGNHLHIYNEEYGITDAIPFNIKNPNFRNYCLAFFKKFNIIYDECDIIENEKNNKRS